jgi:hypothetical protein
MEWKSIETAPKNSKDIMLYCPNSRWGKIIIARYIPQYCLELNDENECDCEEGEDGKIYALEGWYEQCENCHLGDYYEFALNNKPTHWQHLPPLPTINKE